MSLTDTAVLRELVKRQSLQKTVLESAFDKQRSFIVDTSRRKAALCTRRAGKSVAAGLALINEALAYPGASLLYVGLTRESAKRIICKDVLDRLFRQFSIKAAFNKVALTYTLPNGSVIYILGVDSSEKEQEKLLGQKYRLAVIDEAASYTIDLRDLVYKTLEPAMMDLDGTIMLIGTPGNITKSLFFDVTTGSEGGGWSVHKWTSQDNPHMAKKEAKKVAQLIEDEGEVVKTTAWFRQMYLGEWVVESDKLVYRFNETLHAVATLPSELREPKYVLGVDLGFKDATSFVVLAYSKYHKSVYVVHAHKQSKLIIDEVAKTIEALKQRFSFSAMVIDGANAQAVEEMRQKHKLPLEAAQKTNKNDFIEMLNSDLIVGRLKLLLPNAEPLATEYKNLIWDMRFEQRGQTRREHPSCENHLADATLYAWRYCKNYNIYEEPKKQTEEEKIDKWLEQEIYKHERQKQQEDWWEKDYV